MRKIKVVTLIVIILFGSFLTSKMTDPEEIVPVLPPWDIEAVSNPPIGSLAWPPPGEPVLGVEIGVESRAYLLSLLEWHGVLNDHMSGHPIAVTYSALSDSGAVYSRVVDDRTLSFEIHVGIYRNSLVLRDKQTGSLWSQMDGKALMGPLQGRALARIAATRTTWSNWETLHPTTQVLLPPGDRDYGIHPFGDYRSTDAILFPHKYEDNSLRAKDTVLGINIDGHPVAFPLSAISSERVIMHTIGSENIVLAYAYGTAFAYDADNWMFSLASGSMMNDQNDDLWNMTTGVRENDDLSLRSIQANVTLCYWFAWLNMYPETSLYGFESRDVLERTWTVLYWTVGFLLCLLVVLANNYLGRRSAHSWPVKWVVFKRSVLLSAVGLLVFCLLLFDSPRNLQIGNVALQVLFASLFLLLAAVMAYEWNHLKGYESTLIPIDVGDFKYNLGRVFAIQKVDHKELEAKNLGFVSTEGGYVLSDTKTELLFHGMWLLVGNPDGLQARDVAHVRRIVDLSLTMPEDELA